MHNSNYGDFVGDTVFFYVDSTQFDTDDTKESGGVTKQHVVIICF